MPFSPLDVCLIGGGGTMDGVPRGNRGGGDNTKPLQVIETSLVKDSI